MMHLRCRASRVGVVAFACGLLGFAAVVWADAGLPMIFVSYPAMLIALLPVIALETIVFNRTLRGGIKKIISRVGFANAVSTIIGFPLTWLLWVVLSLGFWEPLNHLVRDQSVAKLVLRVTVFGMWLAPYGHDLYWMMPTAVMVGLIPAFFTSVGIEGWMLTRLFKAERALVWRLTWKANVLSYSLLALYALGWLVYSLVMKG